ncbi:phage tail assembly protein [Alcaligenaceae bacterium SJ-26]|nr:phage tail assembly protein [Alcaligenaceae bacterium SJ-26]
MSTTDNSAIVTLDAPIKRGETEITEIVIRKPNAGALRGLSLINVVNMDVQTLIKLLPRVSTPTLTEPEVTLMDPADLAAAGIEVASFLAQKKLRTDFQQA